MGHLCQAVRSWSHPEEGPFVGENIELVEFKNAGVFCWAVRSPFEMHMPIDLNSVILSNISSVNCRLTIRFTAPLQDA